MRILFCQLRNHGDIVRTFPLIDAIKAVYPDAFIGYTCFSEMRKTCELNGNIDVIITQPRFLPVTDTQGGTRILDCSIMQEAIEQVKKYSFTLFVDLHGVFQSAVFGAMCNIPRRLGRSAETAKDGAYLFYTDICPITAKNYNRMERHFIIFNHLYPEIKPITSIASKQSGLLVSIFPGSSKMGILKRWDIEKYISLAKELEKSVKVEFNLGPEEYEIQNKLLASGFNNINLFDDWNSILEQVINSRLVIGNDGVYVHLAVWKNIPAVMICGPLSPQINGIWQFGNGETVYSLEECECSSIWQGVCKKEHICMQSITVQQVAEVAKRYL